MKTRWMNSVIASSQQAQPALPFHRAEKRVRLTGAMLQPARLACAG